MSYDTATGAYQVVLQMDEKQLSKAQALSPSQQLLLSQAAGQAAVQQQRQASPVPVEVCDLLPGRSSGSRTAGSSGHDTQSAAGSCSAAASPQKPSGETPQKLQAWQDEQMQQQCQAQMQRLLEALAKKGYSGVLDADGAPSDGSNNAGASSSPQLAPRIYDPSRAVASLEHQQEVAHNATHVPQRRFCAKVCDFGFSKCLRAGQSHCSTASAGTITHQAPEVLRSGHLSPAADVYAFGIICKLAHFVPGQLLACCLVAPLQQCSSPPPPDAVVSTAQFVACFAGLG
jgi:serine/threonine protein kinase